MLSRISRAFIQLRSFVAVALVVPTIVSAAPSTLADLANDKDTRALSCDVQTPAVTDAKISAQSTAVKTADGRTLFVQTIEPKPGMPTLLLMPGVNRNLLLEEPSGQMLAAQGFGLATYSFSTQPFSVALIAKNETPAFRTKAPTLQDLADETAFFVKSLDSRFGSVIPISLSYSGAVSPGLKGFPMVVETVPMTSTAAVNPQLEQYRQTLKSYEPLNPVFGPTNTRYWLDLAYRQKWTDQVDGVSKQFQLPADRRDDMIEGYMAMSRAAEGFAWDVSKLPAATRRVFILAGNDSASLQTHQIATFQELAKKRGDALMILVLESGHVIPQEQPAAYACALKLSLNAEIKSGLIVIEPSTGKAVLTSGAKAAELLARLRSKAEQNSKSTGDLSQLN